MSTTLRTPSEVSTLVVPVRAGRRRAARRARWFGVLTNVAITLVVLVALAFLVPALLGFQRYVITSGSMTGTYDIGSVVFSETVPVSELAVGDVITYVPPAESGIDHLVTHRIVSIDGQDFRTQGDANPQVDPWTFQLAAATQPRAVASVPWVGHVFLALADRGTRMVVIGVPAAVVALLALAELLTAVRSRDEDDEPVDGADVVSLPSPVGAVVPTTVPTVADTALPRTVREALVVAHAAERALALDAAAVTATDGTERSTATAG